MIFSAENDKCRFKQPMSPRVREILVAIKGCGTQFINSFILNPKCNWLIESQSDILVISELSNADMLLMSF